MSVIEIACQWAEEIAANDEHGYDQAFRWGEKGDYDCSSLVLSAYHQAIPAVPTGWGNTATMEAELMPLGFVQLPVGTELQRGDILLNRTCHAALYIGNGKLVQATGNENGGITGGTPGDQNSREISVSNYYNYPWDIILRYQGEDNSSDTPTDSSNTPTDSSNTPTAYTVKSGDTLWSIAQNCGKTVNELMSINNMGMAEASLIHPGQVIKLTNGLDSVSSSADSDDDSSSVGQTEVTEYTVKSGDTLWGIAEKLLGNGLNYERLMVANNLTSSMIYPGQVLKIP